jgi:hypothetical protein
LLFAVRESVQESLGFSPFELVFGHTVRGPLKLLKEKFLSEDDMSLNLLQYVSDFRNRLTNAFELARLNLKSKQSKMNIRKQSMMRMLKKEVLTLVIEYLLFYLYLENHYRQDTLVLILFKRKSVT